MVTRVVLAGGDLVPTLKVLLTSITGEVDQAYHEFMGVIVESIRFRDRAISDIVLMVQNLDKNLSAQYYVSTRPQMVKVVRDLAMDLFFQAESFKLYNDRGMLMYTYYRHPDPQYDDIILTGIIPLQWNGKLYEPPYPA